MAHWQIETKKQLVEFLPFDGRGFIQVTLYNKDREMFANLTKFEVIYIPLTEDNVKKLQSYKSISALVKFAKANQIQQPQAATLCPAPASTPAKSLEQEQGILFVAFETVGRGKDAEITEISVVDDAEKILFHSRVSPTKSRKNVPTAYPSFAEIWKPLSDVIGRADIAFYNADHSKRMILQSIAKAFDTPKIDHFYTLFPYNKVVCVAELYEGFNNYRLGYFRNYGFQHINSACGQSGLSWRELTKSSGNAIKSARIFNYLDAKGVVQ